MIVLLKKNTLAKQTAIGSCLRRATGACTVHNKYLAFGKAGDHLVNDCARSSLLNCYFGKFRKLNFLHTLTPWQSKLREESGVESLQSKLQEEPGIRTPQSKPRQESIALSSLLELNDSSFCPKS
eukprot:GHVT01048285.1.p1 GENE.GHVT01048285.1~~GHVT01048285.1.p1  ORF type:complete len:125 (+),score=13.24 GHVT01048285.1:1384-1758(+)